MSEKVNKILNIFFFLFCLAVVAIVLTTYLPDPFLWYDEAGQFFISQGLNHYSDPLSLRGGLRDVLVNNGNYNMDPGGFSIALYFWQFFGTNWLFIRVLPAIFFVLFTIVVYYIIKERTHSDVLSAFCATLFFVLPLFTNRITELRAYSMEILGTMLSAWLLIKLSKNCSWRNLLFLLAAQLFFCTSRYGFIIVSFCVSVCALYIVYKNNVFSGFIIKSFVYGIPLVLFVSLIYFGMMRIQNSGVGEMTYASYIIESPRVLLSPLSIMYYITVIWFLRKVYLKQKIDEVHLITILVCTVYFVLSILGLYPWEMHRTISAFLLMLVLWMREIGSYAAGLLKSRLVFATILSLGIVFLLWFHFFDYLHTNKTKDHIAEYVDFVDNNKFEKILVQIHMTPVLRYQYEYGILRDRSDIDHYPEKLVFVKGPKHNDNLVSQGVTDIPEGSLYDVIWCAEDEAPSNCIMFPGYSNFYKVDKQ